MKFQKISAAVPQGEHFDESAVNEGVWMSETHLTSIENALTVAETATAQVTASLETANASIENLNTELATEKENVTKLTGEKEAAEQKVTDQAAEHATAIAAKDAEIATLQAEVARLGKNPSGTGSTVVTQEDEKPDEANATGRPSLLDPSHPLNQYASTQLAYANKNKK